ncbi:MAG: hypothetical protein WBG71_06200 [Leeuwenhoekiella sp.]
MLSQSFSTKKLITRLTLLLPVLGCCIYFFNQEIVARPVLIGKENAMNIDSITNVQKQDSTTLKHRKLKIDVPNFLENPGIILLNEEPVPFENFVAHLDSLTQNWSDNLTSFKIVTQYPTEAPYGNQEFLEKINDAFRKTSTYKNDYYGELNFELKQPNPRIFIKVEDESLWVYGKSTSIQDFAQTINEATAKWSKSNMMNCRIIVSAKNVGNEFQDRLNEAYKVTELYEVNPSKKLLPPPTPPPPAATKSQLPPSPPTPIAQLPAVPTPPVISQELPALRENEKSLPQPTTRSQYINNLKVMKRHGATFYLNGKATDYSEALKFIKQSLNDGKKPKVESSFDPDTVQISTED